jgi:recombination protein RecA
MAEEKKKPLTLEETLKKLNKDYGAGSVITGDKVVNYSEVVSTGSLGLDIAMGVGGDPRGKIIEVIGWESSGKTTVCLYKIAEHQKKGIKCIYVDGENSFDRGYAESLGVKVEDLFIVQLDKNGGEQAYNIAFALIETGEFGLCIIDSQNSLQPKSVLDGEVGDSAIGKHSRMLNQVVVKASALADQFNCTIVFISQLREKIGVMFGSPETTQGGNALRFYSDIRLDVRRSLVKEGDEFKASKTKVKVIKNKVAPPFKIAEFNIIFGEGIDTISELIDLADEVGIIKKWGQKVTHYKLEVLKEPINVFEPLPTERTVEIVEEKYELEDFKDLLKTNDNFFQEIRRRVLEKQTQ